MIAQSYSWIEAMKRAAGMRAIQEVGKTVVCRPVFCRLLPYPLALFI